MIRAVVVDIGGVLYAENDRSLLGERWSGRLGLEAEAWEVLANVDPEGEHLVGAVDEREMFGRFAEALGLDEPTLAELRRDLWDTYCGAPDPVMIDFVRSLRPAYSTALCSNSMDGARREETRRYRLDALADDVVYSHEVGVAKPDPAMYALVCSRLGVGADEVVFIDDRSVNVAAAAEAGMHGVLHLSAASTISQVRRLLGP